MQRFLLVQLTLVLSLAVAGCLESNPQPSPEGSPGGGGGQVGKDAATTADVPGRPDDGADAWQAEDMGPVPEADVPAEVTPHDPCVDDFCPAGEKSAPDPAADGPYPVGVMTYEVSLTDHTGQPRTLKVEVWYPTLDEYAEGPFDQIVFADDAPEYVAERVEKYGDQLPAIPVPAVRDAPVRTEAGPFPLVVFSHGAYGIRFQSVFFTVPLASHGYVVVSADHSGNVLYDLLVDEGYNYDDMVESALNRPLDAVALIDDMEMRNEMPDDPFFAAVDTETVGTCGHSFGGYTSLHLGFTDPRVKAVLPMSPATSPLPILGFQYADFPVPLLMMADALDKTLDVAAEMRDPFLEFPAPKAYFELLTGGHFTYSDICILDLTTIANDMGIEGADNALDDGCADFNIPTEVAHPLINQFGIGFFNYVLRHSTDSLQYFNAAAAEPYADILDYVFDWDSP